jgi:hypothetical protein
MIDGGARSGRISPTAGRGRISRIGRMQMPSGTPKACSQVCATMLGSRRVWRRVRKARRRCRSRSGAGSRSYRYHRRLQDAAIAHRSGQNTQRQFRSRLPFNDLAGGCHVRLVEQQQVALAIQLDATSIGWSFVVKVGDARVELEFGQTPADLARRRVSIRTPASWLRTLNRSEMRGVAGIAVGIAPIRTVVVSPPCIRSMSARSASRSARIRCAQPRMRVPSSVNLSNRRSCPECFAPRVQTPQRVVQLCRVRTAC